MASLVCFISLMILGYSSIANTQCEQGPYACSQNAFISQSCPCWALESRILSSENTIRNLQTLVNYQQSLLQAGIKTSYVRWGKNVCPSTSQIVYSGYAGKSERSEGGGVNYQCLPTDPQWPENATSGYQSQAYMYGVEVQHHNTPVVSDNIHDHDAPCAVCEVQGRSLTLMIPAKQSCPNGWTLEYTGFLVSQRQIHTGSTFECLVSSIVHDYDSPDVDNDNGGLFYVVEARCGSLPCPHYREGFELSCVVCTK